MPRKPGGLPVIIETDMYCDVDDMGALAVAHVLADEGRIDLLCVGVNTPSRYGVGAVRAVNEFYGRPELPVGGMFPQTDDVFPRDYAKFVAERFTTSRGTAPDAPAVDVLRAALAGQEDHSVLIVSIGYFQNLLALLHSAPDSASDLSGEELVIRKVRQTTVMAGQFPVGRETNITDFAEVSRDFVAHWPLPLDFLGWELGFDVITGSGLSPHYSQDNPVAAAYEQYCGKGVGRRSWDPMTVSLAVLGESAGYRYSNHGRVEVLQDGTTTWTEDPTGPHRITFRTRRAEDIATELDQMLLRSPKLAAKSDMVETEVRPADTPN